MARAKSSPQTPFLSELAVTRGRRMLTEGAEQADIPAAGKAGVSRVWWDGGDSSGKKRRLRGKTPPGRLPNPTAQSWTCSRVSMSHVTGSTRALQSSQGTT